MRFTPAFLLPAVLALAACSSPVPAVPDAAWVVNLSSSGPPCTISNSSRQLGDVNATSIQSRVNDQQLVMGFNVNIQCAVSPAASGGGFEVQGHTDFGADALTITVPKMDKSATKDSPATGTVTYLSDATVKPYHGSAHFYFASSSEGIDSGKVWLAFTSDALDDGNGSICPLIESYAAFESCGTSPLN